MGIQVTYEMKDLLKDNAIDVRLESECYDDSREWYAFVGDTYMGQAVDDVLGTYWFDNKTINFEAVAVLDANEVRYTRG